MEWRHVFEQDSVMKRHKRCLKRQLKALRRAERAKRERAALERASGIDEATANEYASGIAEVVYVHAMDPGADGASDIDTLRGASPSAMILSRVDDPFVDEHGYLSVTDEEGLTGDEDAEDSADESDSDASGSGGGDVDSGDSACGGGDGGGDSADDGSSTQSSSCEQDKYFKCLSCEQWHDAEDEARFAQLCPECRHGVRTNADGRCEWCGCEVDDSDGEVDEDLQWLCPHCGPHG